MVLTSNRNIISISLVPEETNKLLNWVKEVKSQDLSAFEECKVLASRLGGHFREDGLTEIGFWTPQLASDLLQSKHIYLEVLTPLEPIDPTQAEQNVTFDRQYLPLEKQGEYLWGVYSGMHGGTKEQIGSFYWVRYWDINTHQWRILGDCLAYSLPYGVYGPAELYDLHQLHNNRADLPYFAQQQEEAEGDIFQVKPPRNLLQLHIGTTSPNGYLSGLTEFYQKLAEKVENNVPLTPTEQNFIAYDAVQLMPIEPSLEYREKHDLGRGFFQLPEEDLNEINSHINSIDVTLKKPDMHGWGYDILIFGSSATDTTVLETLRLEELIEFIATLHNFPTGPIQVVYDLVYGHADNQALDLLNRSFFTEPGMYGQEINHQHPTVRAILLEMQRRKMNTGADAFRIDGGQDFQYFDPKSAKIEYDDAYLKAMAEIPQQVSIYQRYPFPIFEDGRPWPNPGWQEISTYRDVLEYLPDVLQWGPLIFAHNKPTVKNFWDKKWRRVKEVMEMGSHWVTGCANHDTMHRGSWVDTDGEINHYLGETLPEIFRKGYDNPAITMWVYGLSPGYPMDFIHATMRSPWTFFRNTESRYTIKIIAKEAGFVDWQIDPEMYQRENAFPQLKEMGFQTQQQLSQFVWKLQKAVNETGYDLEEIAHRCNYDTVKELQEFGIAYMEDMRNICWIWQHEGAVSPEQVAYNLALRRFRLDHDWLINDLSKEDQFDRISDSDRTLFYGLRHGPSEQVAMVTHMGGEPITVNIGDWLQIDVNEWEIAIASPGL
ncbi:MAG: glucosylglycerol hydrolase, partial [Chroococcales cyanobacterium]